MAVSDPWNRRQFLNAATVVSSSALSALSWPLSHAEPTPETTTIRIVDTEITCIAPQIVAQEMLYAEGFKEVKYLKWGKDTQHFPPEDTLGRGS